MASSASMLLAVVAVIIYSVDMNRNPESPCVETSYVGCGEEHYATVGTRFISCHHVVMPTTLRLEILQ